MEIKENLDLTGNFLLDAKVTNPPSSDDHVVNKEFVDEGDAFVALTSPGGAVGRLPAGVLSDDTQLEILYKIIYGSLAAVYQIPIPTCSNLITGIHEVGEVVDEFITVTFNSHDASSRLQRFLGTGITPGAYTSGETLDLTDWVVQDGEQGWLCEVSYGASTVVKQNSRGVDDTSGWFGPGINDSPIVGFTGVWPFFWQLDGVNSGIRALTNKVVQPLGTLRFVVGAGVARNLYIAVPGDMRIYSSINFFTDNSGSWTKSLSILNDLTNSGFTSTYSTFTLNVPAASGETVITVLFRPMTGFVTGMSFVDDNYIASEYVI